MNDRILIIDDEPAFTRMLKVRLEKLGPFTVKEENDPTCALRTAREFDPDLILLDIMMPYVDGSELATRFLADPLFRHVPIVFLTAMVSQAEIHAGSWGEVGGRTYLPKPVQWNDLVRCIAAKLRGAEAAMA